MDLRPIGTNRDVAVAAVATQAAEAVDRNHLQATLDIGHRGHIQVFYDVTAAYEDPCAMRYVAQSLRDFLASLPELPDALVAPEARAWPLVGSAQTLGPWPAVLLRKSVPCAGAYARVAYTNKTNGTRQVYLCAPQDRACTARKVVVLDDGISGGHTVDATIALCKAAGMEVLGVFGMIRYQLPGKPVRNAFWDTWDTRTCTVFDLSPAGRPAAPPTGVSAPPPPAAPRVVPRGIGAPGTDTPDIATRGMAAHDAEVARGPNSNVPIIVSKYRFA